ncbi:MAG: zinc metallopeptidase [Proteobacteria bacterium]|nr:zinc metallopeptidase [Pseudomonadota bacterium]
MKIRRIEIFKTMPLADKLFTILLVLVGIVFFANGLYLVGISGLLLLAGAIVFHFVTEIFRSVEIEIITEGFEKNKKSAESSRGTAVGAAANTNNGMIRSIIDKKKQNPQQGLLDGLMDSSATPEKDEEQARADHDFLVEMFRKKEEAMRTAAPVASADPSVQKKVIKEQEAYIKELMKPTIIPQRELAEKAAKKDKN